MYTQEHPNILEAIEDLSAVVDYEDWEREIELLEQEGEDEFHHRKISWLRDETFDGARSHLKGIFSAIYDYLRAIESEDYSELRNPKSQRGLRSIVLLVGEAARRLDRYTELFHGASPGAISQMEEIHRIHHLYQKKIEPMVSAAGGDEADELKRVREDIDYELFWLRRENGQPFLEKSLIDRIQLAITLRGYAEEEYSGDDPLVEVMIWKDKMAQVSARNLVQSIRPLLARLYPIAKGKRNDPMIALLSDALIALTLASYRDNLLWRSPAKPSWSYFNDFHTLLRSAMSTPEYRKLASYKNIRSRFYQTVREVIYTLCFNIYTGERVTRELMGVIDHLLIGAEQKEMASDQIESDFAELTRRLEGHPNGPLLKLYDQLQEKEIDGFDPIMRGNLPEKLFEVEWKGLFHTLLRLPTPTAQSYIHKAKVTEEFRTFIRSCKSGAVEQSLLMVDLQDRTSWKEFARIKAIEEIAEIEENFTVVSLAKQTDFYHQSGLYAEINEWPLFKAALIEQLSLPGSGYKFPDEIAQRLFPEFVDGIVGEIHTLYFEEKELLSRQEREEFIDLVHFYLEVKLLDIAAPDYFSFTCKNGLDLGSAESIQFMAVWQLFSKGKIDSNWMEWLRATLWGPTLMVRERLLYRSVVIRLIGVIRRVEGALAREGRERLVDEGLFFSKPIGSAEMIAPIPSDESL